MYFQSYLGRFTEKSTYKVYFEAYKSDIVYFYYTDVIMVLPTTETIRKKKRYKEALAIIYIKKIIAINPSPPVNLK